MNFSSPTGSVLSCPGWWKRVNHRAIVGDGVYLKAQRVRRAVPFNLAHMEHLPTSSGQLFKRRDATQYGELRSVVGDDPRLSVRGLLLGSFQNHLDVRFLHRLPQIPMHQKTTASIQHAA